MRLRIISLAAFLMAFLYGENAYAYPQFQFSTDNVRCNMCHFSPAGGGLINAWGREEAADTISRDGGNGDLLHGLIEQPDWLALGGDFRGVLGLKDTEAEGTDLLAFPMQSDIYSRAEFGDFKVNLTLGMRGSARNRDAPFYTRFVSREHSLLWQPKATGSYVRVGRFYAPYGLRVVDHTNYIRRDLGFYALEETYGVSGGYLKDDDWEMHLSAFVRDPLLKVGPEGGGFAAMYERRFSENSAAWGVQSKAQFSPTSQQYWLGGTIKYWLPSLDLLAMGEIDMSLRNVDTDGADPIFGAIAHLNLSYFLTEGIMLGTAIEAKHSDFALRGKDAEAVSLNLQYFPKAHLEFHLLAKAERTRNTRDLLSFLMFHYYL